MKLRLFASAVVILLVANAASAAEVTVRQAGKVFAPGEVTIKRGDTVRFVNDDRATHTVYARQSGAEFDLGAMRPGDEGVHVFSEAGVFTVRCAVHPRMEMTIMVAE